MTKESRILAGLRERELQAIYAISSAIVQAEDLESAMAQIVQHTRDVFIFDNMAIYANDHNDALEPKYARIIGRGRSAEADLGWGGSVALEAYESGETIMRQDKLTGWETDRLCWRDFLAIPLRTGDTNFGALVFGRFGGPPYTEDQIHLAEFIAGHIAQLLRHSKLVERIATFEAERRLQQMQEDFIAMVSHELCTPLGFIKGYTTTLLREDTHWDELTSREFLTIINEETDRLRDLIDDLLDSSRLQSGNLQLHMTTLNLQNLLREVIVRAYPRYKSLTIRTRLSADLTIQGDPIRLAQVFDNLFSNAVKYAPGSPVYIAAEQHDDRVLIPVMDEGPGLTTEQLPHLFERFYRTPEAKLTAHGSGLGLFISRQIIRAHGGELTAQSEPGKGMTFVIELPIFKVEDPEFTQTKGDEP